jgi:hypothetical protein
MTQRAPVDSFRGRSATTPSHQRKGLSAAVSESSTAPSDAVVSPEAPFPGHLRRLAERPYGWPVFGSGRAVATPGRAAARGLVNLAGTSATNGARSPLTAPLGESTLLGAGFRWPTGAAPALTCLPQAIGSRGRAVSDSSQHRHPWPILHSYFTSEFRKL